MNRYKKVQEDLFIHPKKWLITGVAGFIGSNLLESLLKLNQKVVGLDNFSTGSKDNLTQVRSEVSEKQWNNFTLIEGDICHYETCSKAVHKVDYVLQQAALGSVPRSIANPLRTNASNITGFLNILEASKEEKVKSFTYAASSSTYGDNLSLPKVEEKIGKPLSPYAVTKYVNELYAQVYSQTYGFKSIGLRYFNVFGKRQNPNGAYAAVIPKWITAMYNNENIYINGDGSTSRDFCYIENVIQANILAATSNEKAKNQVYNIALGDRTSLNQLFFFIKESIEKNYLIYSKKPIYRSFRPGDIGHSQANITKAIKNLQYNPQDKVRPGLQSTIEWYHNLTNKTQMNKNLNELSNPTKQV